MTEARKREKNKLQEIHEERSSYTKNMKKAIYKIKLLFFFLLATLLTLLSEDITEWIEFGIKLCASAIIPALFPFMILSDYLICTSGEITSNQKNLFEKLLSIPQGSGSVFLIGAFAGFPTGAYALKNLYDRGGVDKKDFLRLSVMVNNPSLAFIVSGVGLGMRGNIIEGFVLYMCVISASVTVGFIFKKYNVKKSEEFHFSNEIPRQRFNIISSIKSAGISSLTISSYIIFACALLGALCGITNNELSIIFSSIFCEVGSASKLISASSLFNQKESLYLTAFALGFSGISAILQVFYHFPKEARKSIFLFSKFITGILTVIFVFIIYSAFSILF